MTDERFPFTPIEYASFGAPAAPRTVVVLRQGATATEDPDPEVTTARDVRVIAVRLRDGEIEDPTAYNGATAAETTAAALVELLAGQVGGDAIGVVGVGATGAIAIAVAAASGIDVDRLALVAVPAPQTPLARDLAAEIAGAVTAKVLLMNGQKDPDAAAAAAAWHKATFATARIEMVPSPGEGDLRLDLAAVWARVLSHTAPGTARGGGRRP